jgi:hypothetical protein
MPSDKALLATRECLAMMAEAKQALVSADGIGSELLPALIAWDNETPIGYAIVQNPHVGKLTHTNLTLAAGLMVSGWHANGLAVAMEGYVEDASPFTTNNGDGPSLASRFPTDHTIDEALWVAYANKDDEACMGVMTFKQQVGRIVAFDEPDFSRDHQLDDFSEPGSVPDIVVRALTTIEPQPMPKSATVDQCRQRIAIEIHKLGFSVYLDGSEPWVAIDEAEVNLDNYEW